MFRIFCIWFPLAIGSAAAAEPDSLAIDTNIQALHLPFGTILDPVFASPAGTQVTRYTRCGDSALWTGHYLAAQAYRYSVTNSTEALNNARAAIAGLRSLVDVTGTNLLARCLVPANSPFAAGIKSEEASNGVYISGGNVWIGNTSRDQYSGAMFGLAVTYDLINDAQIRASISRLVTQLVDFLINHNWEIVMPDGTLSTTFVLRPDQILAFLQVAAHINPEHFQPVLNQQSVLFTSVPILVDSASDNSYFKFNLDSINLFNLVRLADTVPNRTAYKILRNHTASHQNAFFNMIDRGLNGASATRDGETLFLLDQWLKRPRRDPAFDDSAVVPVCGGQACSPIPIPLRVPTDFIWQRSPYQLTGGGSGLIEGAGIDYILPYWMARYYGVATHFAVQSAAPGAIASLYGTCMGAVTSITVTDAQGISRPTTIFHTSPSQINFLIPPATAIGLATFQTSAGSANAGVEAVSPTLFATAPGPTGYVILYGTGIRNASSGVTVTLNGTPAAVTYSGPQSQFLGLDQVNVTVPQTTHGAVTVLLTVDYQTSNAISVSLP